MPTSRNIGHIFIFHDDSEVRPTPTNLPRGEFIRVGQWPDAKSYHGRSKETFTPKEINAIRMRSAYLNRSISQHHFPLTHVWHDKDRGIKISTLRYVVRRLAGVPGLSKENNLADLEALSETCIVIWCLECDREPFRNTADQVLANLDRRGPRSPEDAKWLTIIAFVLRRDQGLKGHLENFVWHSTSELQGLQRQLENLIWRSTSELQFPEDLSQWVNDRRKQVLERIHTFFMEETLQLLGLYPNSQPVRNIYSNLSKDSHQFGIGSLLRWAWSSHVTREGGLIEISPQQMTDGVLEILRREVGDDHIQPGGAGELYATPHDYAVPSGQRGGRGGDNLKFFKAIFKSPQKEDKGIEAIRKVIDKAEKRKRNTFRELRQDDIASLIRSRNAEQDRWTTGFLAAPPQANGHAVAPTSNPQ